MGVRFKRSALIAPENRAEAMQSAGEVAGHVGETFRLDITFGTEFSGVLGWRWL